MEHLRFFRIHDTVLCHRKIFNKPNMEYINIDDSQTGIEFQGPLVEDYLCKQCCKRLRAIAKHRENVEGNTFNWMGQIERILRSV